MKMRPEHLAALRADLTPHDTAERRARYLAGDFPRSELVEDLNMRYRWDLYWDCIGTVRSELSYLSTGHIDTALRSIVPMVRATA